MNLTDSYFLSPFVTVDQPNKKDKPMRYEQNSLAVSVQAAPAQAVDNSLEYLQSRLRAIFWGKNAELDKIYSDPRPSTFKELKAWLKDGNYRLELPKIWEEDEEHRYFISDVFCWGKTAPDKKARKKAYDKLEEAFQAAMDLVNVVTDEQARLKALQDFQDYKV